MLAVSEDVKLWKGDKNQSTENKMESPVGINRRDALIDYAQGA